MFESFREAIARGDHVPEDLREAYMCCHLIERIYDSSREGCRELPVDSSFAFLE